VERANQVIITACGSSRYAALVGRYLLSRTASKFCEVVMASEFHYFSDSVDHDTVVIAVSQSGETDDVVEGVLRAGHRGARVLSLVNKEGTALSELSDRIINLKVGPEIAQAATKSFSGQLAIFYLLSFAMVNRFDMAVDKLEHLSREIEEFIPHHQASLRDLARRCREKEDFYCIARGINFAIASEGALKLKQVAKVHAEGLPAGELKHGTLALIEEGTPVVAICPKDFTFPETMTNMMEAKARGAFIVGVSDEENKSYDTWVPIPKVEELYYPLVTVTPLQFLAYYVALERGENPDLSSGLDETAAD
jgi:glucosamine--fructose-6-phosphate aminotransferase (isomerizing)